MRKTALALTAAIAFAALPAAAKKNDPTIRLEFRPQQTVGAVVVDLPGGMTRQAVSLNVRDGRPGDAATSIGTRTDDDDRMTTLLATNDVVDHVEAALRETLPQWGIQVDDGAPFGLDAQIVRFHVTETNHPVGAMYRGEVRLEAELARRDGTVLWSGSASGDASRYGRKFSGDNANEVLSDATLEALGAMLRNTRLQNAWMGVPETDTASKDEPSAPAGPLTPAELLSEVRRLKREGLEAATIESWVGRQELTTTLSSEDVAEWKRAEIPESVIRIALDLPVR
jgi:hypothetical protein